MLYFTDCCLNKQSRSYEDKVHFNNSFLLPPLAQRDGRSRCLPLASPAFQEIEEATQGLSMQNVEAPQASPYEHRKGTAARLLRALPIPPAYSFFVEKIWLELCGREADGGFDVRWRRLNLHLCWHFRMSPCKRWAPDNRSHRAEGSRAALLGQDLPGGMLAPHAGSWQKLAVCCGPCWWRLIIIQGLCDWAINLISTLHT